MEDYFNKFRTIIYNDTAVKDLTSRVVLDNRVRATPTSFYPWEVKAGQRADHIAHAYYDDATYDWLIYLSTGIIDPYYGWYLDESQFESFIADKYGSFEEANRRTHIYTLSWSDADFDISPQTYDNNLSDRHRKYYSPIFGMSKKVLSYRRKREDWTMNTNKIVQFTVEYATDEQIANGEYIHFKTAGLQVGSAEVITCNSTSITAQHIVGNTSPNNFIVSIVSAANCTITDTDEIAINIPDDEAVYWTPMSKYELERGLNESKKFVQLLDAGRALDTAETIRIKLAET